MRRSLCYLSQLWNSISSNRPYAGYLNYMKEGLYILMDNHTNHGDSTVQSSALPHAAVTPSPRKKKKLLHIEFLRILCIWLVMFTHSATSGFSLYIPMQHSRWFPLYILVPFWVKISVPIFFMISGALLLGKDEPISVVLYIHPGDRLLFPVSLSGIPAYDSHLEGTHTQHDQYTLSLSYRIKSFLCRIYPRFFLPYL